MKKRKIFIDKLQKAEGKIEISNEFIKDGEGEIEEVMLKEFNDFDSKNEYEKDLYESFTQYILDFKNNIKLVKLVDGKLIKIEREIYTFKKLRYECYIENNIINHKNYKFLGSTGFYLCDVFQEFLKISYKLRENAIDKLEEFLTETKKTTSVIYPESKLESAQSNIKPINKFKLDLNVEEICALFYLINKINNKSKKEGIELSRFISDNFSANTKNVISVPNISNTYFEITSKKIKSKCIQQIQIYLGNLIKEAKNYYK